MKKMFLALVLGFSLLWCGSALAAVTTAPCPSPNALPDFLGSNAVAAWATDDGTSIEFWFSSINVDPVDGVPGLIKYCIYDTPKPLTLTTGAVGANGAHWLAKKGTVKSDFERPKGNRTNIPLDGATVDMGNATGWGMPFDGTILLHINDPDVCAALYPSPDPLLYPNPSTCFVIPRDRPYTNSLSCTDGDNQLAYNAMPFNVINCGPPSEAFEAQATNEFGDEVTIAGTKRTLDQLQVAFNSYGCQSGYWFNGLCQSTPGSTFDHLITARIYDADDVTPGHELAILSQTKTFPFRPASDPVRCLASNGDDPAQWFNENKVVGGLVTGGCQYSQVVVQTFVFPGDIQLPDDGRVVWTVAFNTSHSGYAPLGDLNPCNSLAGGCGYDSLNVSTKSFTGAPYSGIDVDPAESWQSWWLGGYPSPWGSGVLQPLQAATQAPYPPHDLFLGLTPLGAIYTK